MIYTNAFVLSILGYTASAKLLGGSNGQKMGQFLGYVATEEKNYNSNGEFAKRLGQYMENDDFINQCNWDADHNTDEHDPVHCAHNQFSDWTREEYLGMLGLNVGDLDEDIVDVSEDEDEEEGFLQSTMPGMLGIAQATAVDHTPYMTPVKHQGSCGSCWAFAANTALEGTIGVQQQQVSQRLSEQQVVDCTLNTSDNQSKFGKSYNMSGCSGGWMSGAWSFQKDQGAMTNADYPYKARHQTCKHDASKIVGKTKSFGQTGQRNVKKMKEQIMKAPGAVALNASSKQFEFYRSGTIKGCDSNSLNHGVVVVGYSDQLVKKCKVNDWWVECKEETVNGAGRDAQGDTNYWKVQNSWGSSWGDRGFLKVEIQDGDGVCGINKTGIHWVDWKW